MKQVTWMHFCFLMRRILLLIFFRDSFNIKSYVDVKTTEQHWPILVSCEVWKRTCLIRVHFKPSLPLVEIYVHLNLIKRHNVRKCYFDNLEGRSRGTAITDNVVSFAEAGRSLYTLCEKLIKVRFQVLTAANLKTFVCWVVAPSSLLEVYWYFGDSWAHSLTS